MKSLIKNAGYRMLGSINAPRFLHKFLYRNGEAAVLMYHGICKKAPEMFDWCMLSEADFVEQIRYLKRHFNVVKLSELEDAMAQNQSGKPPAAITFDDGYQNNFDVAFPALAREKLPATIFLTTGLIDSDSTIWTGQIYHIFNTTRLSSFEWKNQRYSINNTSEKLAASVAIKAQLKNEPLSTILTEVNNLATLLQVEQLDIGADNLFRMLDRNSIQAMASSGLIEFGAHTVNHPILSQLTEEAQRQEIAQSMASVEELTGKPCRFFAYPNGTPTDYSPQTQAIVKDLGLRAALTTSESMLSNDSSSQAWPRINIGADMDFNRFKVSVHGTRLIFTGSNA